MCVRVRVHACVYSCMTLCLFVHSYVCYVALHVHIIIIIRASTVASTEGLTATCAAAFGLPNLTKNGTIYQQEFIIYILRRVSYSHIPL